jgi:hypothetical protein
VWGGGKNKEQKKNLKETFAIFKILFPGISQDSKLIFENAPN